MHGHVSNAGSGFSWEEKPDKVTTYTTVSPGSYRRKSEKKIKRIKAYHFVGIIILIHENALSHACVIVSHPAVFINDNYIRLT